MYFANAKHTVLTKAVHLYAFTEGILKERKHAHMYSYTTTGYKPIVLVNIVLKFVFSTFDIEWGLVLI